ncbi:type III pantothenate kinase [Massiliimalia timonensis]|uniref:type III pantothenate kinase n=1 Tax=Massiliimalia timonensis TaxID=1987501 RepID=UPI000B8B09CB|nr:type III pantothenate kinase [Massiliimalia timonensis]MBS7174974.1 type III pantothenate kinase [Clostridiales bacterium]
MLLAVDIGNTNMEFGVFDQEQLKASFRLATHHDVTSDELGLSIRQFFLIHEILPETIEDVLISSVVPQVVYSVKNAMRKYLSIEPLIVQENFSIPIVNKYDNPSEVGADRLVNAYAGFRKYGGGIVVVDFGTATNFDVIDQEGAYLGGVLYPGIKISLEALVQRTSKLPKVEIEAPGRMIGTNTAMSMQSGIVYGYTGAVVRIIENISKELGYQPKVIATGGLARVIGEQTDIFSYIDRSLTLDGLCLIYRDYQAGKQ